MFDPACLPEKVQERLMLIGYWQCAPELRAQFDRWERLDALQVDAAEYQLRLMETALAR